MLTPIAPQIAPNALQVMQWYVTVLPSCALRQSSCHRIHCAIECVTACSVHSVMHGAGYHVSIVALCQRVHSRMHCAIHGATASSVHNFISQNFLREAKLMAVAVEAPKE